jgi:hypothetical protein
VTWATQDLKVLYAVLSTISKLYNMVYFVTYFAAVITGLTIHLKGLGSKAFSLSSVAP